MTDTLRVLLVDHKDLFPDHFPRPTYSMQHFLNYFHLEGVVLLDSFENIYGRTMEVFQLAAGDLTQEQTDYLKTSRRIATFGVVTTPMPYERSNLYWEFQDGEHWYPCPLAKDVYEDSLAGRWEPPFGA